MFTQKIFTLSDHHTAAWTVHFIDKDHYVKSSLTEENKTQCVWKKNTPESPMALLKIQATDNSVCVTAKMSAAGFVKDQNHVSWG